MFDDFYKLDGRPFQLTPDPAFYFESATHRKALSYLGYGLAQGEGFVVITGEVGAGKSTLVAHLMATIDPERLTATQIVTSALDGDEIVHVVAQAFGLMIDGHDKASALGAIESFLHEEARAGRRCLLIVDETQNLSVEALEELRMLSNFQLGAHPLLQTLLLGQPEFREAIGDNPALEQLSQRVIASHHLEAMSANEVQPYIEYRMECVGWDGNPQFDQRVFAEIYSATGGVPRRINQIANRLLLLGAVEQRTRIDSSLLRQVLAELADEGKVDKPRREAKPKPEADPVPRSQAQTAPPVDAIARAQLEAMLAERDVQIDELQRAVIELANAADDRAEAPDTSSADLGEFFERLTALEGRICEQDRTIRHTLTMLIEWIETGEGDRAVA